MGKKEIIMKPIVSWHDRNEKGELRVNYMSVNDYNEMKKVFKEYAQSFFFPQPPKSA
jgi:hypothetical protein